MTREFAQSTVVQDPAGTRLGIRHILLWMVGIAVCMAIDRFFESIDNFGRNDGPSAIYWRMYSMLGAAINGACYASLVLLLSTLFRRDRNGFPLQPGHLMMVVSGLGVIIWWTCKGVSYATGNFNSLESYLISYALITILCFIVAFLGFAGHIRSIRYQSPWLLYFALDGVLNAWMTLGFALEVLFHSNLLSLIQLPITLIHIAIVIGACWVDRKNSRRRDFLHWTGVSTSIVSSFSWAVTMILARSGLL